MNIRVSPNVIYFFDNILFLGISNQFAIQNTHNCRKSSGGAVASLGKVFLEDIVNSFGDELLGEVAFAFPEFSTPLKFEQSPQMLDAVQGGRIRRKEIQLNTQFRRQIDSVIRSMRPMIVQYDHAPL